MAHLLCQPSSLELGVSDPVSNRLENILDLGLTNERVSVRRTHQRLQQSMDAVRDMDSMIRRRFVWLRPSVVVVMDLLPQHVQTMDLE